MQAGAAWWATSIGRVCRIPAGNAVGVHRCGPGAHGFPPTLPTSAAPGRNLEPTIRTPADRAQSLVVRVVGIPSAPRGRAYRHRRSPAACSFIYPPGETSASPSPHRARIGRESLQERLTALVRNRKPAGSSRPPWREAPPTPSSPPTSPASKTWGEIREKARVSGAPTVLYQELYLGQRVLQGFRPIPT